MCAFGPVSAPRPPPPPAQPPLAAPTHPLLPPSSADPPWLLALVLVTFDLARGQVVEASHPPHSLPAALLDLICLHAMPDSAAASRAPEDAFYVFRLPDPRRPLLLAHTLFRQFPDPSNVRGYFQKALVLVSPLPCLAVFRHMLAALADPAFDRPHPALRDAYRHVEAWPRPRPGKEEETPLPFADVTIALALPESFPASFAAPRASVRARADVRGLARPLAVRSLPPAPSCPRASAAPFHEVDLAVALRGLHDRVPTLWELLALGEPVLVVGSTPTQAAAAVLALVGLLHPLPLVGDWRPYFCIQDELYLRLRKAKDVKEVLPRGGVFGVTNSHIVDTLGFAHVLRLPAVPGVGKRRKAGLVSTHQRSLRKSRTLTGLMGAAVRAAAGRKDGTAEGKAGEVRACVFDKITRPFLRAFDRYLVPTWGGGEAVTAEPYASDPFGRKLGLLELDAAAFPTMQDLTSPGVAALFRFGAAPSSRARDLYSRFVRGPVFGAWWEGARAAAEDECRVLHRTDVMEACVRGTRAVTGSLGEEGASDAAAVDMVVDLCLRVQQEVRDAAEEDYAFREKLGALLERLGRRLPEEAQANLGKLGKEEGVCKQMVSIS